MIGTQRLRGAENGALLGNDIAAVKEHNKAFRRLSFSVSLRLCVDIPLSSAIHHSSSDGALAARESRIGRPYHSYRLVYSRTTLVFVRKQQDQTVFGQRRCSSTTANPPRLIWIITAADNQVRQFLRHLLSRQRSQGVFILLNFDRMQHHREILR